LPRISFLPLCLEDAVVTEEPELEELVDAERPLFREVVDAERPRFREFADAERTFLAGTFSSTFSSAPAESS